MEEHHFATRPELEELLQSFRLSSTNVLVSLENGTRTEQIWIAVHALAWADHEERRQLEFRGLTIAGRRFRASVDYAHPDRSGIILDPDD